MDRLIFQFHSTEPDQPPPIDQILSHPIILTDRIRLAVDDAKFYKLECSDVGKHVDRLSHLLRSAVRLSDHSTTLYERPVRRIFNDVVRNLNRALTLLRKCRHRGLIRRFVSIVTAADFRKVVNVIEASIGDMKWLLSIFNSGEESGTGDGGIVLTLPPIASNDPILAWIWSSIASLHTNSLNFKIEAARELATLARDSDRNKTVIVEELGIPPLLKLLKEELSPETQIAGAVALFNLANDKTRARAVFNEHGVPILAQAFRNSPILVQIEIAKLIARVAEHDSYSQEGFVRENVIATLVTLLSINIFNDDRGKINKFLRRSFGSAIEINKQVERGAVMSNFGNKKALSSSVWPRNKSGSKTETSQLILEFNTNCSGALWMLAKGNVANCRRITETKGLLCLAKLIEKERGELQINCLMTIMEITSAAESNPDIRRSAFKTNSLASKAAAEQLLRLIDESDNPVIMVPAIRSIGHLARTFPARQTHVISPLVKQLGHVNPDVATESVITLGKFTCPDNFLRAEHSKTVVDFEGVKPVMKLLMGDERTQYHALSLLCYLALHAGKNEQFQQARVLTALEGADKSVANQYSELKDLVVKAVHHLNISGY
ncbi:uncharacterized protein LOC143584221 [Bidens hawaiensis]|uniref:uncharacterized protein LOC143584221 n=1 Tax=Bidens hawaiensis TaxID=980011 RepID=UPI00404B499A